MAFHHKHHYIKQTLLRPNTDCTPCPRRRCIKLGAISTSSVSLDTLIAFKPAINKRRTSAHTQDRKRKQGVYVGYARRCEHHGCSCAPSAQSVPLSEVRHPASDKRRGRRRRPKSPPTAPTGWAARVCCLLLKQSLLSAAQDRACVRAARK